MSWPEASEKILRSHIPVGSRLLVAVSGGPDSVALLHFLRGQPYALIVGHVDHQLRSSSKTDARFVKKLAKRWDISCHIARVNVVTYAKAHHLSIEESARDLRYQALSAIAKKERCDAILTAHTAGDQSETVLMNFLRGSGPAGLAGIPETRTSSGSYGKILVRPLLGVRKEQLLAYLKRHAVPFRVDPTNRSMRFSRNRIRHSVLPYLEKIAPGLLERLPQAADIFREEERYWDALVEREFRKTARKNGKRFTVVLPQLLGYHKALSRRILRRILPGLSFQDIEHVFSLARSPQRMSWLEFPGHVWVKREKNKLVVVQKRTG